MATRKVFKSGRAGGKDYVVIDHIDESYFINDKAARIVAQPMGMKVKYLITGHPRSGTRWISTLCIQYGLDIPHEVAGKDGICSWQHITSGKYSVKADKVIHLVRNPLKTIASTAYVLDPSAFPLMFKDIGYPNSQDKIRIAMYTWYHWNKLIEKRANSRFKFEDILKDPLPFFGEFDLTPSVLRAQPPKINSFNHPLLTWKDLKEKDRIMYDKVLELATEYGY